MPITRRRRVKKRLTGPEQELLDVVVRDAVAQAEEEENPVYYPPSQVAAEAVKAVLASPVFAPRIAAPARRRSTKTKTPARRTRRRARVPTAKSKLVAKLRAELKKCKADQKRINRDLKSLRSSRKK